jgi:K+-transporting ATPase ATPase C chain
MTSNTPLPLRLLAAAVRVFLVMTVVLGLAYPLVMTGVAQVLFPDRADGSLVEVDGRLVGAENIGQSFTRSVTENGRPVRSEDGALVTEPDPAYFQSRPSAAGAGYDPLSSSASNYGAEHPELVKLVQQRRSAVVTLDGVAGSDVAPDALLASGSGLDPHISPAYAQQQVPRVAGERGLSPDQVRALVAEHTEGRSLGFLGEPRVNVLMLNLALDALAVDPGGADSQ